MHCRQTNFLNFLSERRKLVFWTIAKRLKIKSDLVTQLLRTQTGIRSLRQRGQKQMTFSKIQALAKASTNFKSMGPIAIHQTFGSANVKALSPERFMCYFLAGATSLRSTEVVPKQSTNTY